MCNFTRIIARAVSRGNRDVLPRPYVFNRPAIVDHFFMPKPIFGVVVEAAEGRNVLCFHDFRPSRNLTIGPKKQFSSAFDFQGVIIRSTGVLVTCCHGMS